MTDLLERAIERVRALPAGQQDELARVLMSLAGDDATVYRFTPDEEADVIEAEAEIERGELATDAEVEAMFSKHRL